MQCALILADVQHAFLNSPFWRVQIQDDIEKQDRFAWAYLALAVLALGIALDGIEAWRDKAEKHPLTTYENVALCLAARARSAGIISTALIIREGLGDGLYRTKAVSDTNFTISKAKHAL